jgi:hypothetical protein
VRLDASAEEPLGLTASAGVDWYDSSCLVDPKKVDFVVFEVDRALSERLAMLTSMLALSLAALVGSLRLVA